MKLIFAIVILGINFVLAAGVEYKFSSIDCHESGMTAKTELCSVNGTSADIITTIKRSLAKINILLGFYKYDGEKYRQIFKLSRVEWCAIMAGTTKPNQMVKLIFNTVKESIPQLFHKCPFEGRFEVHNITMKNGKFLSIYPSGKYRMNIKLYDEIDDEIIFIKVVLELRN